MTKRDYDSTVAWIAGMSAQLYGRLQRWWHTLIGKFSGHFGLTARDLNGRTVFIGCTCGRIFWGK